MRNFHAATRSNYTKPSIEACVPLLDGKRQVFVDVVEVGVGNRLYELIELYRITCVLISNPSANHAQVSPLTETTMTAVYEREHNVVAGAHRRYLRSNVLDHARALVTKDERRWRIGPMIAVADIGMAYPAGDKLDENLFRARWPKHRLFQHQGLAAPCHHGGSKQAPALGHAGMR